MGLLGLGRWLRNEADNIGSVITGQPAHGPAPAPTPAPQAPQQPQLSVAPVHNPYLSSAPSLPNQSLPTTIAHPAPLANLPSGIHTFGRTSLLGAQQPSLASQVKLGLQQKLAAPLAAGAQVHELGQQYVTRPIAEIGATLSGNTYHPNGGLNKAIFGDQPIKPIQTAAKGVYNAVQGGHENLPLTHTPVPTWAAAPAAGADVALHVAQDLPVVGGIVKEAAKVVHPLSDVAGLQAAKATGLHPEHIVNDNEANTLRDYSDAISGGKVGNLNETHQQARAIANNIGLDITSGSPADRVNRIYDYLGQRNSFINTRNNILQGGYAKIPGTPDELTPQQIEANVQETLKDHVPQGGFITKESPVIGGRQDIIRAVKPEGKPLEPRQESIVAPKAAKMAEEPKLPRSADLDREVQNVLRNGGTTDEAAQVIFDHNPQMGLAEVTRQVSRIAKESGIDLGEKDPTLNPYYNKIKMPPPTTDEQAILNRQAVQKNLADKVNQVDRAAKGMSDNDISLLDRLRNEKASDVAKDANNPDQFLNVAAKAKDLTDYQQELGRMLGQSTAYRPYYGARLMFDVSTPERAQAVEAYKAMLKKNPGYAQQRAYKTYKEASDASGGLLQRANKNFIEDLNKDAQMRANDLGELALQQGIENVHPGQVKIGEIGSMPGEGTFKQLQIAGGKKISVPNNLADDLNHRAAYQYRKGPAGTLLKVYDQGINAPIKFFKLALGGFHDLNTYLGFVTHQIFSGTTKGLVKAISVQASPERFEQALEHFRSDAAENGSNASTMEWANIGGLTHGTQEIAADASSDVLTKIPVIKQLHDAMFQREIPYMKLKTLSQYVEGRDITNPEDVAYVRRAAKATNYAQGGLNRAVEGFTPTGAKHWGRALLALDFNEGQVRSLLNAVSKGGPDGAIARKTIAGRMALIAMPGTVAWAVSHPNERQKPGEWLKTIADQLVDPHIASNFKTPSGIPKNIDFITNDAGKTFRAIAPAFDKNNPDKTIGLKHEASANSAAGISELLQLRNNKDYYGNPIIVKDKNGKVNVAKSAANTALTVAPIPANQVARVAQGKETPAEAAINISGVGHTAANPEDPRMQILNSRQKVYNSQPQDTKAAIDLVHPSWNQELTQDQKNAIYTNPAYASNKWNVLAHNQDAVDALRKQDAVAQKNGQPGDPLFALSPNDYKTVTTYEWLKNSDPGSGANNSAAVLYAQNKGLIDKYAQDSQAYNQTMSNLYQQSGGLKGGQQDNNVDIGGVPHFTVTPQMQSAVNQYYQIGDSKQRSQFLAGHPEVSQYFNAQFQYENARRAALNEPLLKDFPKADQQTQDFINQYMAASPANRKGLISSNPSLYNKMKNYMADVDAYTLSKTMGQYQFQGQNLSQQNLKNIYSLGNYDITKLPNGQYAQIAGTLANGQGLAGSGISTGNGTFSPGSIKAGGAGGGYGHKSKRIKLRKPYVKHVKKFHTTKAHKVFLETPPSPIKIRNKVNKHIGIKRTTYL